MDNKTKKSITLINRLKTVSRLLRRVRKVITLYIDDNYLKLLVVEGNEVTRHVTLALEPGLIRDGIIIDKMQMAAKIKRLLRDQKVKKKDIIIGCSGFHCLFRVIALPKIPKAALAEAVEWEAKKSLPVPIEEFYIQWQITFEDKESMELFLAAIPRNAADILINTLRDAGIKPRVLELAPLAIARAASMDSAIIIDFRKAEADLVIIVAGIPHIIRTLPIPSKISSPLDMVPKIREEIRRTIKFYNSSHPDKPIGADVPILMSGKLRAEKEAHQYLADELGHPVLRIEPPLTYTEDTNLSEYMINFGLALRRVSVRQHKATLAVNLNALPAVYQPKPPTLSTILLPIGVLAAIYLVFVLSTNLRELSNEVASLRGQADRANQLLTSVLEKRELQKKELSELQANVDAAKASYQDFKKVLGYFSDYQDMINGDAESAITLKTEDINLTGITHTVDELSVIGTSISEEDILKYVGALRASGRFYKVIITTMTRGDNGVDFILTITPRKMD